MMGEVKQYRLDQSFYKVHKEQKVVLAWMPQVRTAKWFLLIARVI